MISNNHRQLHERILQVVRTDLITVLPAMSSADDNQLLNKIFRNYRAIKKSAHSTGIRLTVVGNQLMHKHYTAYDYKFQGSRNHSVLVALDKNMLWPYYIGSTVITFYNQQDAAWFQLNGNDIEHFVSFI
jgi:chaperone required for assembly of F1-ATPase